MSISLASFMATCSRFLASAAPGKGLTFLTPASQPQSSITQCNAVRSDDFLFFLGMPFTCMIKLFSGAELISKVDLYSSKRSRRYTTLPFKALTNTSASQGKKAAHFIVHQNNSLKRLHRLNNNFPRYGYPCFFWYGSTAGGHGQQCDNMTRQSNGQVLDISFS